MDTLMPRSQLLLILGFILGSSWDLLWRPFCDCSVIWDAKMDGSFQVNVFSDPGMEMMVEPDGCICYNHSKNCGF